jgi:hypothetical protein
MSASYSQQLVRQRRQAGTDFSMPGVSQMNRLASLQPSLRLRLARIAIIWNIQTAATLMHMETMAISER